jgi:hypothetical protein
MAPAVRKFVLTAHVTSSLAWFGAVAAFFALAIAGVASANSQVVRGAYLAMDLVNTFTVVPFCFASLVTGVVQSLGTPWGLVRHYWVLVKLVVTVVSTAILMLHTRLIGYTATAALDARFIGADLGKLRIQLAADAGAALVVLLFATVLAVYKPRGVTPFGERGRPQRG